MTERIRLIASKDVSRIQLITGATNTLQTRDLQQLSQCLGASSSSKTRCIIVESLVPQVFSLGLDPEFVLGLQPVERLDVFLNLARLMLAAVECPVPIIVDVNGPAIAGGAVLAALGDFVLMSRKSAKVCFSEAKVRLPVPRFVQELVSRKVGRGSALLEMVLLGKNISAESALANGFATELYSDDISRQQLIDSFVGRINRLDSEVVATTLLASKGELATEVKLFLSTPGSFAAFVSDSYLGKGLREMLAKSPV